MLELASRHNVGESVAIDVRDRDILGGSRFPPFGERRERPLVGVRGAEGYSDVSVRHTVVFGVGLMYRDDVLVTVKVEIGDCEAVAARNWHASGFQVVDDVLPPRDEASVGGTCAAERLSDWQPVLAAVRTAACREQRRGDPWKEGWRIAIHARATAIGA